MHSSENQHSALSQVIAEKVLRRAADIFPSKQPPQLVFQELQVSAFNHLLYLRFDVDRIPRGLYIKFHNLTERNRAEILRRCNVEFEILRYLESQLEQYPGLNVVRPLMVLPEEAALVTEEASGVTLQALLSRHGRWPFAWLPHSKLPHYYEACGRWLKLFHDTTRQEGTRWSPASTYHYCSGRIEKLARSNHPGLETLSFPRLHEVLARFLKDMEQTKPLVCGRHNDFAPHNIIAAKNGDITVLDFNMFDYDATIFDYRNFLFRLEYQASDPLFSSSMFRVLKNAFEYGYGKTQDTNSPEYRLATLRLVLTKLRVLTDFTAKGWWQHINARHQLRVQVDLLHSLAPISK